MITFFKVLTIFRRVTHFFGRGIFSLVWLIILKYSPVKFLKCDPFFQVWHVFWIRQIFPGVTHFSKCDPFFTCDSFLHLWPSFSSVINFFLWPLFASVIHFASMAPVGFWSLNYFSKFNPFFKCDPFLQVRPVFLSVTYYHKCE